MEYLIYLLIAIVFYYYIKSRFRKKKESKINAGALAFSKILILGSKIDGKINDAEIGMVKETVGNVLRDESLGFGIQNTKEYKKDKKKYINNVYEKADNEFEELYNKLKKATNLESVSTELDSLLDPIIIDIENLESESYKYKELLITYLALIIGNDYEFADNEIEYFHIVRKKLKIRKDKADEILRSIFLDRKKEMLEALELIPTVTRKMVDYIDSEFDDLQSLTKMNVEEFREYVPGLSKSSAMAIQRKVNAFDKISGSD